MKIHKANKDLFFLNEIFFVSMFCLGIFHITFGVLSTKTTQSYLPLMVDLLDIPFFTCFACYTLTTILIKTNKDFSKPIFEWQKIVILAIVMTIVLLTLEIIV